MFGLYKGCWKLGSWEWLHWFLQRGSPLKSSGSDPPAGFESYILFSFPRNANFDRKPPEEAGCGEQCSAVNSYRDIKRLWAKQINLRREVLAIIWSRMMYRCVYWYRWSCKAAFSDSSQSSAAMTALTKLPCSALRLFFFFGGNNRYHKLNRRPCQGFSAWFAAS